jgi:hypothetical protein
MEKDKYGILNHAMLLIEQHLQFEGGKVAPFCVASDLPKICGDCKIPGHDLKANYKEAEKSMIGFIANAAKPLKTADEIVWLFRDACYGFAVLGVRADALHKKVMGAPEASEPDKLATLIRADVMNKPCGCGLGLGYGLDEVEEIFNSLPGEFCGFSNDPIDRLISEAYFGGKSFQEDSEALLAVYVLQHLSKLKSKMDTEYFTNVLLSTGHCTKHITSSAWRERSLIGYPNTDAAPSLNGTYTNELNHEFVRIFTDKLDVILSSEAKDDFAVADMRNSLYKIAVNACFGYNGNVMRTYMAISDILDICERGGKSITEKDIDGYGYRQYLNYSIVLPRSNVIFGKTYTANIEGLRQFCDMIDDLNLSDMQGFAAMSERIRRL